MNAFVVSSWDIANAIGPDDPDDEDISMLFSTWDAAARYIASRGFGGVANIIPVTVVRRNDPEPRVEKFAPLQETGPDERFAWPI